MKKPEGFKFGWKVVSPRGDGSFFSCFAPSGGSMDYAIDKPTRRKAGCGPLAVFKSSKAAAKFFRDYLSLKLEMLPCWYKPSKLKTAALWCPSMSYSGRPDGKCWCGNDCIPPSTAFADVVILKKGKGSR